MRRLEKTMASRPAAMDSAPLDSALQKAAAMTERIFAQAEAVTAHCGGFNLVWSLYDRVHLEISLPGQIGAMAPRGSGPEAGPLAAAPLRRSRWWRDAARHALPFAFSLASLWRFRMRGKPSIALWTGDFHDPRNGGDFRLGGLYRHLQDMDVPFVEFIRANHRGGLLQAIRNAWARRRWAIYYDACAFFLSRSGLPPTDFSRMQDPEARAVLSGYARDLDLTRAAVPLFRKWFADLRIRGLISWEYSSRQAALVTASKLLGLPVIGFMHGAGMRAYMLHEFIPAKAGPIGPDVFGVWSAWWKDYYGAHAGIYGKIEVAGPMRLPSVRSERPAAPRSGKPLALWISEPLLDPEEAVAWLRHLKDRYRLVIKKRPSTADAFYNGLMAGFPEFRELETRDGDIFKAIREADVVLGSHSTGVIDAALVGVPFVLVATRKWGDYFELSEADAPFRMYVRDAAELDASLLWLRDGNAETALAAIRERFYGDGTTDGSRWVAAAAAAALRKAAP